MTDIAVEVRGLTKSYGNVNALAGIDLQIGHGEVFALLGPNGAGKTTTVEILEGYRHRDGGEVAVLGLDPGRQRARLKKHIGIVLQSTGVDRFLTVAETIAMYSGYYPRPRPVDEVIEVVGLTEKRNSRVVKLSGGQQRRLDVAIALCGDPQLLFLDEPTIGLDVVSKQAVRAFLTELRDRGDTTIVLTTHDLADIERLCRRLVVIDRGRVVHDGTLGALHERYGSRRRVLVELDEQLSAPIELPGVVQESSSANGRLITFSLDGSTTAGELVGRLASVAQLRDISVQEPAIEDVIARLYASSTTPPHPRRSRP